MKLKILTIFLSLIILFALPAAAQQDDPFKESEFEKVTKSGWDQFQQRFEDVKWTGQGLYKKTVIDDISTLELRARLQAAFGKPTKKLKDLIDTENFRPAKAIQFEYWFVVDDKIPLMVLDVDGPFSVGLVYGGASKYIDLMPQIKRAFSKKLMDVENMGEFRDYFYSPEREQWFNAAYNNGEFTKEEIKSPPGMNISFDY